MYHDIEPMYLRKCIHFKLTTPAGIVSDPSNVVFDRLIILNEKLVQLLILLYIVGALRSILYMALFATRQLEQTCYIFKFLRLNIVVDEIRFSVHLDGRDGCFA